MKKIIALLLSAIICLPLIACGGESPTGNNNSETKQESDGNNNSAENNDATVDGSIAPTMYFPYCAELTQTECLLLQA